MDYKGLILKDKDDNIIYPEHILELQFREIDIREKELELKKVQSENNYKFAKESLKLQADDVKDLRKQENRKERKAFILISLSIMAMFVVIVLAMYLGKDDFLSEVFRTLGYIFGSGITGYGIGIHKNKAKTKSVKEE